MLPSCFTLKKKCAFRPEGCLSKGYSAIPTKTRTRSRSGARCPVYFQPGVTHFFPEALFLSYSLSCSAADPPGRAPNPPPFLAHLHPPPSGCPKADTSQDDGPKTQVLLFGEGQNLPQGRAWLRLPVCTNNSEAPAWGERLFMATQPRPAHCAAPAPGQPHPVRPRTTRDCHQLTHLAASQAWLP